MTGLRRALIMIGATALVAGLITIPLALSSEHIRPAGIYIASQLVIGWSFVGTGLFMWLRRPENRLGLYMTAVGFTWLLSSLLASNDGYIFFVGELAAGLPYAFLVQMLLSFPDGRLHSGFEQALAAATWFDAIIMQWLPLPWLQFPNSPHCERCPTNPLLVSDSKQLVDAIDKAQAAIAVLIAIGLVVALVRRRRAMAPAQRRALTPVLWTGALALIVFTSVLAAKLSGVQSPVTNTLYWAGLIPLAAVPYAFLVGLMRSRFTRAGAVSELVASLGAKPERRGRGLRESLAEAFGDPTLVLAYWIPERGHYVDADGHRIELPEPGGDRAWTPITRDGATVAALIHDAALLDERQLLETAGAAAGLALENERLHAELRARVEELERSRERLIEVGLAERRKLERNLHDGAQQRLVALALSLRLARDRIDRDPDGARELLTESMGELDSATGELRELARGIHPAVLSDRGLPAALRALAGRVPLDIELLETPEQRLPPTVEIASYYVVAEALTNVARYAHAGNAAVRVSQLNGSVTVEVSDDGVGGADPAHGSGLRGLADRVAALDGRLEVDSPPGGGTTIRALIPCG
ncbi:MAG TPA: sensor histidine kinase [Solirubrobacteraceae bacterium]|nr:sensor histidine kinase [Solirubrobacteraceae bacterium]